MTTATGASPSVVGLVSLMTAILPHRGPIATQPRRAVAHRGCGAFIRSADHFPKSRSVPLMRSSAENTPVIGFSALPSHCSMLAVELQTATYGAFLAPPTQSSPVPPHW